MKGKVIYKETQSFKYTWSWYLMIAVAVLMFSIFGRGFYQQIIMGSEWGDRPMSDASLIITMIFSVGLTAGIVVFISIHKLVIQVDEGTVRYKFYPYFSQYRTLTSDKVKKLYVRKYKPILEFGGWGYRMRWKKKAFNIKGNWGLQIEFRDGKKLLLGTQKPKELDKAIDQLKSNWKMS